MCQCWHFLFARNSMYTDFLAILPFFPHMKSCTAHFKSYFNSYYKYDSQTTSKKLSIDITRVMLLQDNTSHSEEKFLETSKKLHLIHKARVKAISFGILLSIIEHPCVNTLNSNNLFTHCLRNDTKKAVTNFVTASFLTWTS